MASGRTHIIRVEHLSRVEGEGALHLTVEGDQVRELRLEIFEPPRFFEAFLRGRDFVEVADIVARICGICPVAYQMSALHAIESILGIEPGPQIRELRRLFYCGEWIESHVLHVAMLAAPDALGYPSVIEMAVDHRAAVERALALRRLGNRILELLGGRAIHPVSARPGGFTRVPTRAEMAALVPELERGRERALELLAWIGTFERRPRPLEVELVALRHPDEYPLNEGRIVSSAGLDIPVSGWEQTFEEYQVPHSTALHARIRGRGAYLVGPIARMSLNFDRLPEPARAAARALGFTVPCTDPAQGVVARGVETLFAIDEALRIARSYIPPEVPFVAAEPRAGIGYGATEAPRGTLFHRFELDATGLVVNARIVPPTSQNQATIENDLRDLAPRILDLSPEDATHACEVVIRNYDPCISCSTHFVKLSIDRGGEHPAAAPGVAAGGRPVRVVCVGSPLGADRLGLEVAARLRECAASQILAGTLEVVEADRPGVTLAELCAGAETVVVVDAVHGAPAGQIVVRALGEVASLGSLRRATSSHGLGVVEGLGLASALGAAPPAGWLVGIGIGDAAEDPAGACPDLGDRVGAIVGELERLLARSFAREQGA